MKQTKTQQKLTVAEGLAVGMRALDVESLPNNKIWFEFAVQHAWRNWVYAGHFPSLLGQFGGNEIWLAVGKSGNSRRMHRWEIEAGRMYPVTFDDWTPQECWETSLRETGVPLHGWVDLARLVHHHIREAEQSRNQP